MKMPKNFTEKAKWAGNYKKNHPHERLGQAFCNEFQVQCEDLFYTEDNYEALCMIEDIIIEKFGVLEYYEAK